MDEFRGMKLVHKEGDKNVAVNIKVDFDRTKHLSDASVKRRNIIRERCMAKERAKEEEEKKKLLAEEEIREKERFDLLHNVLFNFLVFVNVSKKRFGLFCG